VALQEALKARKSGRSPGVAAPAGAAAASAGAKANKRYLILTYVAEFDRVHYPLPLVYADAATSPAVLKRQLRRLKREITTFRSRAGLADAVPALTATGLAPAATTALIASVSGLQRENDILRAKVAEQQVSRPGLCCACLSGPRARRHCRLLELTHARQPAPSFLLRAPRVKCSGQMRNYRRRRGS
jgi:hypothetical protein